MADIHSIPAGIILAIGFTAQLFFSLRTLFQWWKSEKAKKVVSPSAYWVLSVVGSYLFFVYGILRDDFSIVLGQLISYYIYLWNLNAKGIWKRLGLVLQTILLATPVVAVLLMIQDAQTYIANFFRNEDIPFWLVIFGSAGQIIFTFRIPIHLLAQASPVDASDRILGHQPVRFQCDYRLRNLPSGSCAHFGPIVWFCGIYT